MRWSRGKRTEPARRSGGKRIGDGAEGGRAEGGQRTAQSGRKVQRASKRTGIRKESRSNRRSGPRANRPAGGTTRSARGKAKNGLVNPAARTREDRPRPGPAADAPWTDLLKAGRRSAVPRRSGDARKQHRTKRTGATGKGRGQNDGRRNTGTDVEMGWTRVRRRTGTGRKEVDGSAARRGRTCPKNA